MIMMGPLINCAHLFDNSTYIHLNIKVSLKKKDRFFPISPKSKNNLCNVCEEFCQKMNCVFMCLLKCLNYLLWLFTQEMFVSLCWNIFQIISYQFNPELGREPTNGEKKIAWSQVSSLLRSSIFIFVILKAPDYYSRGWSTTLANYPSKIFIFRSGLKNYKDKGNRIWIFFLNVNPST